MTLPFPFKLSWAPEKAHGRERGIFFFSEYTPNFIRFLPTYAGSSSEGPRPNEVRYDCLLKIIYSDEAQRRGFRQIVVRGRSRPASTPTWTFTPGGASTPTVNLGTKYVQPSTVLFVEVFVRVIGLFANKVGERLSEHGRLKLPPDPVGLNLR